MLVLLHLSWVRADVSCARHSHHGSTTAMAMPEGHGHASMDGMVAQGTHTEKSPCDTPATTDGCSALTSCGSSFDGGARESTTLGRVAESEPMPAYTATALSRAIVPETPPPRA